MRVGWTAIGTAALLAVGVIGLEGAEPAYTIRLWSGPGPGDGPAKGPEKDQSKPGEGLVAGKPLIRLGNVWEPTLSVYKPAPEKDTGASVLICPGGGYHILALDLEGTEVCEWLNSIGVSGVVLKYRVPRREGREKHEPALQDAQRAMGLLRQHAKEWGLDSRRIGVLGFSAGGHLAAALSNNHGQRIYPRVDPADDLSCRPDFSVLVYPAYLTDEKKGDTVSPELPVTTNTPPTFIVISQDDPVRVENVLGYVGELQRKKVPVELHLYPKGGHGYGLRRTELPVTAWPLPAAEWFRQNQWLRRP